MGFDLPPIPPHLQVARSIDKHIQELKSKGVAKYACPDCRNEFTSINLFGVVTCPKCNKTFNPSERSRR